MTINNVKHLFKCAALHHGGLHGGHYTAIIHKDYDSITYVNDDQVYENGDIMTVLSSKFVRSQVTSLVYEAKSDVMPSSLYCDLKNYINEGTTKLLITQTVLPLIITANCI